MDRVSKGLGPGGGAAIDRAVRGRIAEIMSAAGVDTGRIGLEVLWDMPPDFVRSYEWLWRLIAEGERSLGGGRNDGEVGVAADPKASAMGGGGKGRLRDTPKSREGLGTVVVRSGGSARRGGSGGSRGSSGLGVAGHGLEDVARLKERIDKRLRGMARDIADELKEVMGLDVESGGEVMKLDMAKVTAMRAGLMSAAEGREGRDSVDAIDE